MSAKTPNTGETPLISVIIICHNDGKWLACCLESVREQTIFDRIEVIIADNASDDGSDKLAKQLIADWPRAQFLPTGGDNGFCVATNMAVRIATGQFLQILNPDTWLEEDFLQQMHTALDESGASATGPVVLNYEDDSLQAQGCPGFDFTGNYMPPRPGEAPDPLFCMTGFFLIRKEVFARVGMLDEKCFMYGEEMDLSWRIWIAGERIVPARKARIHHRGAVGVNPAGGTRIVENRTSAQKRFLANRNRLLFVAKNCRHFLLLMLLPCASLTVLEGLLTFALTKSWSLARQTCFGAIGDCWRLRHHVMAQRRLIRGFRRHGDFWMLRFFRFGFGRWEEVERIVKSGFPKFK